MRIISGRYKGRVLVAKLPEGVRPTLDAARESIFNILPNYCDLSDARVCDIFAGSGALGLEAISRGAAHVSFVDINRKALRCVEENAKALGIEQSHFSLLNSDASDYVQDCTENFDLIFIDPPYALHALNNIVRTIASRHLLHEDGIIVAEHGFAEHLLTDPWLELCNTRSFGETVVDFLRMRTTDSAANEAGV